MRELFTRGLRGEAQKETEIGPVPESWTSSPLGLPRTYRNGSTPKKTVPEYWPAAHIHGGNERRSLRPRNLRGRQFVTARSARRMPFAAHQAGRGAARNHGPRENVGALALFSRSRLPSTDMRLCRDRHLSGPIRHSCAVTLKRSMNICVKSALVVAAPGRAQLAIRSARPSDPTSPTSTSRREIVDILDAIDRKIDLHQAQAGGPRRAVQALLHKLMTGEIRVADLDLSRSEARRKPEAAA